MHHKLRYITYFLIILLIAGGLYFLMRKITAPVNTNNNIVSTTTLNNTISNPNEYKNTDYGFSIKLPLTWKDYSVIEDEWEGYNSDPTKYTNVPGQVITEKGPLTSIRHPDWEYKAPRQDIPIMVFTTSQWNDMQADRFHIGAAPINPDEIGRNSKYVFAIPARYNFAYLTGFEEVDQILKSDSFKAF